MRTPLAKDLILAQSQYAFFDIDKYPDHEFSREIQIIVEKVLGIRPRKHLEVMHDLLSMLMKDAKASKLTGISE